MVTNFETGQVYWLSSEYLTSQHNSLVGTNANRWLLSTSLNSSWSTFMHTLSSDYNDWYDPKLPAPIWTPAGGLSAARWQSDDRRG